MSNGLPLYCALNPLQKQLDASIIIAGQQGVGIHKLHDLLLIHELLLCLVANERQKKLVDIVDLIAEAKDPMDVLIMGKKLPIHII